MRRWLGVVIALALLTLPALAQLPGMAPDNADSFLQGHSDRWIGNMASPNGAVFGEARVESESSRQTMLFVDLHNLTPGAVYTLWYADGKDGDLLPVGDPDQMQANPRGEIHVHRSLNFAPVSNTVRVEVKVQPSQGPARDILDGNLGRG